MKPSEIKAGLEVLCQERTNIEGTWDVIERYIMPFRGQMFRTNVGETNIDWRTREVFDSTAIIAAQNLASALQGSLTPPALKWFELAFEDAKLNQDHDAMKWLEQSGEICFNALQDSNFNIESSETYLDLVGFGSSVIVEESESEVEWDGLMFQSIPIKECFFEVDVNGKLMRLYRKLSWTVSQIVAKFGDKVPEKVKEKARSPQAATEKMDVVFCIFKRNTDTKYPLQPDKRPFGYSYVLLNTAELLGEEGGYYEMPAFVPRWRKTNGSKWGHSQSMLALGDVLTLNQLVELILTSLEKVVDPTTLTTERGLLSDLNLGHGEIAVVRNIDDVKAYESKARFDVSELNREKLQDQINRAFYVDQLQLKQSPAMTAQEVIARMELMQRLLGPTLARLQNDFLDPLIQRTFNILYRAGQIPEMPDVVKQYLGIKTGAINKAATKIVDMFKGKRRENIKDLRITYVSPMYRAQKADQVNAVQQWLVLLGSMAEVAPEIMDIPNLEEIGRGTAKMLGVPLTMVGSAVDVKRKSDARKAEQQRQSALQAIETLGGATKDLASARAATQ